MKRLLPAVALFATSCSVADNLSDDEILAELDNVYAVEGTGADRRIVYRSRAEVSTWYMRWFPLVPIRGLLGNVFGEREEVELENPAAHVRALVRELPDETGGDLLACARATARLASLAQLDRTAATRITALDGLASMVRQLELALFAGALDETGATADPDRIARARAALELAEPSRRGDETWNDTRLEPYREALRTLTERPLDGWIPRLLLLDDLTVLFAVETDDRVRPAIATALQRAIVHCVEGVLLDTIADRDPQFVEVRLCALERMRELGGPRTVPLMLAVMSASPAELARGASRIDPSWLVQLRLIHYCGQLEGSLAETTVNLPGRQGWEATAPIDFLATTVLTQQTYYSKLRTPALLALTWCLRRERLDPDPTWVREWWEQRGS